MKTWSSCCGFPKKRSCPTSFRLSQGPPQESETHHSHLTEAGVSLSVQSMSVKSNLKGVHLGREAIGGRTLKVSHRLFFDHSGRKFISRSQWQEYDAGNHAQRALCALLESLWWRFTLGCFSWHVCHGTRFSLLPASLAQKIKECKAALLAQDNHLLGGRFLATPLQVFCPTGAKPICQAWALQSNDVANWNHLILNAKYLFAHKLESTPFLEKPRGNWWLHARIQTSNCVIFISELALYVQPVWGAEVCSLSQAAPWSLIRNFPGPLLSQLLCFRDELQVISKCWLQSFLGWIDLIKMLDFSSAFELLTDTTQHEVSSIAQLGQQLLLCSYLLALGVKLMLMERTWWDFLGAEIYIPVSKASGLSQWTTEALNLMRNLIPFRYTCARLPDCLKKFYSILYSLLHKHTECFTAWWPTSSFLHPGRCTAWITPGPAFCHGYFADMRCQGTVFLGSAWFQARQPHASFSWVESLYSDVCFLLYKYPVISHRETTSSTRPVSSTSIDI